MTKLLHSLRAAIDLASIMVGVIVIGLIAGVISASVFAVIPWAQDNVAQGNLDAVKAAQSVSRAADARYQPLESLETAGKIQNSGTVAATTNTAGTCYAALSRSDSGKVYYSTDTEPKPRQLFGGIGTDCITEAALQHMMDSIGGDLDAAGPVPEGAELAPHISLWTLADGAYRESDYIVLPAIGASATTPFIHVDGATGAKTALTSWVPSGGDRNVLLHVEYFDADKKLVLSSAGYTGNGQGMEYPTDQWFTPEITRMHELGPNVEYMQVRVTVTAEWGAPGTKIRAGGITIVR